MQFRVFQLAATIAACTLFWCMPARAAWVDDFDNGDPLTNSAHTGWMISYAGPAIGSKPNLPPSIGDVDPSDDYSFLAEPGRLPSAVNLRTRRDNVDNGYLALMTASPLPEMDFLSPGKASQLTIRDWNSGPVNNGVLGGGAGFTNTYMTIAASELGQFGLAPRSADEIWFRQDHNDLSISFFTNINGTVLDALGTRTDYFGMTPNIGTIFDLTDNTGDSINPITFIDGQLLMLNFDILLDPTNASATIWATHPTNGRTYSSNLTWAHGLTLADWDAGSAGSYVRLQPYAALEEAPDLYRGTDLSVGYIAASVPPAGVAGDFDGDGDVDGADFVAWQTNFPKAEGGTLDTGDADGDGDVDGADFVVWQTNFPFTPSPGVAAVPEPHAVVLAAIGGLVAAAALRRRKR